MGETALSGIKIAELRKVQTLPVAPVPSQLPPLSLHKFSLLNSSESGSKMTANKVSAKEWPGVHTGLRVARAGPVLSEPRDGNVGT